MGKHKKNRFDEFMLKFDKYDTPTNIDKQCSLGEFFNYCLIIEDRKTGVEKKHYFDNKENIAKILGNQELLSQEGQIGVKIFNKDGKLTSHWEKVM